MNSVQTSPMTMSAKFSGGPKRSAKPPSSGAKKVSATTDNVPATNDPIAEMPNAAPARP